MSQRLGNQLFVSFLVVASAVSCVQLPALFYLHRNRDTITLNTMVGSLKV